jgi:PTS system N-acetylglucosamine-specific IIC component
MIAGVTGGLLYNRFHDIQLPDCLSFFGGARFVPIASGVCCLLIGIVLAVAWPPVQVAIKTLGNWLTTIGPAGGFIFGCLNRLLVVTGLQNIVNSLAWFVFGSFTTATGSVVTGDLHRFFAGDPTAGNFMAGFFPVMMFGLPAACLAMYHEAYAAQRTACKALLLSMALTSFLTGVTEPIELTFVFMAPTLYLIHALLTGLSLAVCQALGIHVGFTFSAGAIDYVMSYGLSRNGWLVIPVGLAYGLIYYVVFRIGIRRFDVATPGRMVTAAAPACPMPGSGRRRSWCQGRKG